MGSGKAVSRRAAARMTWALPTQSVAIITKTTSSRMNWNAPPARPMPPASTVRAAEPARLAAELASCSSPPSRPGSSRSQPSSESNHASVSGLFHQPLSRKRSSVRTPATACGVISEMTATMGRSTATESAAAYSERDNFSDIPPDQRAYSG